VSPASSRAQKRQRRNLLVSVLAVVVISLGSFAAVFSAKWTPARPRPGRGLSVVYQTAKNVPQSELQETVNILNNRVNGLGVSGAQVSTAGNNEISVSIPGVKDAATVLADIGNTAQLYFRPVECTAYPLTLSRPPRPPRPRRPAGREGALGQRHAARLRFDLRHQRRQPRRHPNSSVQGYSSNNPSPDPGSPSTPAPAPREELRAEAPCSSRACRPAAPPRALRYVLGPADDGHLHRLGRGPAEPDRAWEVNYSLKGSAGSKLWDKVARRTSTCCSGSSSTASCSRPLIQPSQATFTSFDGQGTISGGNMTEADAKSLALAMEFGSLPVRLKELTTQTVSPTLGKSALKAGLGAGIAGLILVLLYVLLYYRALGAVVISGLALTAARCGPSSRRWGIPRSARASTWRVSRASSCPSASPSTPTSSISND
jgi:preprotein translocase subunit SecD